MLSSKESHDNRRAFEHAVAQQELEGLTLPKAALDDLKRIAQGKMALSDALRNAYARFTNAEILKS